MFAEGLVAGGFEGGQGRGEGFFGEAFVEGKALVVGRLLGEGGAGADDLCGFRCDFGGENLGALFERMDLGALDGSVPKLCELGFARDEFVLKFSNLLKLDSGLAFGVEHLFFVAVGGEGEGGGAGPLLGMRDLGGGELDQVLPGTGVEFVD